MPSNNDLFLSKLTKNTPPYFRGLIYAPPRTGKTTLLGTMAFDERTSPTLILSIEGGEKSLEGIPDEKLHIFPVKTWDDFNIAYKYLQDNPKKYKGLGVDSLSALHTFSLFTIVEAEVATKKRNMGDLEIQQQDYGKAMVQMRRVLQSLDKLPLHIFYTALSKSETEPMEGWVKKPAMSGQLADEVVGMFDASIYMSIEKSKGKETTNSSRIMVLQNFPGVRAGIRVPYGKTIPDFLRLDGTGITQLLNLLEVK